MLRSVFYHQDALHLTRNRQRNSNGKGAINVINLSGCCKGTPHLQRLAV